MDAHAQLEVGCSLECIAIRARADNEPCFKLDLCLLSHFQIDVATFSDEVLQIDWQLNDIFVTGPPGALLFDRDQRSH